MANTIQIKRGAKSSLPTLAAGQLGFCTDTFELYVGTGSANKFIGSPGVIVNPMTTQGDVIYGGSSGAPARLPKGTAGQILTMNAGATAPEWQTPSGAPAESETNDGSKNANFTIDWSSSKKHKVTLAAAGLTVTFTAPSGAASGLIFKIIQDATGSRTITTWPATVKWAGGAAPTLSTAANAVDIVSFYWDGTNYWGACANAFA